METKYKVRLNDLAIEELRPTTESVLDDENDPFYEYCVIYDSRSYKKETFELSLEGVKALAKELAWWTYCSRDNAQYDDYYKPIYRACKTALANANKVLASAGEDPVHP
jgi:hypothetical protein